MYINGALHVANAVGESFLMEWMESRAIRWDGERFAH